MSKNLSEAEDTLTELDKKVSEVYHLYLKFFLALKDLPESEQDILLENKFTEIMRSSLSLQDAVSCLYTVSQVAARIIGLKKSKPISNAINQQLNEGCPCQTCMESENKLKLNTPLKSEDFVLTNKPNSKIIN